MPTFARNTGQLGCSRSAFHANEAPPKIDAWRPSKPSSISMSMTRRQGSSAYLRSAFCFLACWRSYSLFFLDIFRRPDTKSRPFPFSRRSLGFYLCREGCGSSSSESEFTTNSDDLNLPLPVLLTLYRGSGPRDSSALLFNETGAADFRALLW